MRNLLLLVASALIVAACGGASGGQATTPTTAGTVASAPDQSDADTSAPETVGESPTGKRDDTTTVAPTVDGPAAPEFDLALADGTTFSLDTVDKPVYLVFWAEW